MLKREEMSSRSDNLLLSRLSPPDFAKMAPYLEQVELELGEQLVVSGDELEHIYFPKGAMISLVSVLEGKGVETGVVGREGALGIPVMFGTGSTPMQSMVQIPGAAFRMEAGDYKVERDWCGALRDILLKYAHVMMVEVSQTAACNNLHDINGRLARWLLMSSDCVGSNELNLTHELLATMLGSRRAGVTVAAGSLKDRGVISYHRGRITILSRKGLEGAACECYDVVKREFGRVLSGRR